MLDKKKEARGLSQQQQRLGTVIFVDENEKRAKNNFRKTKRRKINQNADHDCRGCCSSVIRNKVKVALVDEDGRIISRHLRRVAGNTV